MAMAAAGATANIMASEENRSQNDLLEFDPQHLEAAAQYDHGQQQLGAAVQQQQLQHEQQQQEQPQQQQEDRSSSEPDILAFDAEFGGFDPFGPNYYKG